jgi:dihydrofolate reductase
MRVFIIASLTADGYIARNQTELVDWSSKEDKQLFVKLTKEAGVMVMGGNTYRTIGRPLPGRRSIVYSRQTIDHEGVETTQEDPAELIKRLEAEGHEAVAICGGRSIYDMFLQADLVDELYLTVEPLLFGNGVNLSSAALTTKLKLIDNTMLNDNTYLVHYKVVR